MSEIFIRNTFPVLPVLLKDYITNLSSVLPCYVLVGHYLSGDRGRKNVNQVLRSSFRAALKDTGIQPNRPG